jgi:peptidoglycan L-alanyl-D-glutamate endopeptidase CwlK
MANRDLDALQPVVRDAAKAALAECKAKGLSVIVTNTYRSGQEQTELYAQGRTAPGKIVTNAKAGQSLHQYRVALDIVPNPNGKPDWNGDHPIWHEIAAVFIAHGFEWGYNWKRFKEMPHFQMTGGHDLAWFQAGNILT